MFKKTFWLLQAAARYVSAAILNRYLKLIDAERFFFTQADVDAQAEQTTACSKPRVAKNSYASNPIQARTSASSTPPCSPPARLAAADRPVAGEAVLAASATTRGLAPVLK